jgi:hypothetical protein
MRAPPLSVSSARYLTPFAPPTVLFLSPLATSAIPVQFLDHHPIQGICDKTLPQSVLLLRCSLPSLLRMRRSLTSVTSPQTEAHPKGALYTTTTTSTSAQLGTPSPPVLPNQNSRAGITMDSLSDSKELSHQHPPSLLLLLPVCVPLREEGGAPRKKGM